MRAAADVPPDVAAGGMGGIGFGDVKTRREGAPGVHGLDDAVHAVAVVVAGGYEEDVREGLLEGLGAFFHEGEVVRLALVIQIDVGVFQEVAALGLFVNGTQAFDFGGNLFLRADGGVAEAEGGEFSFVMEVLDDFEIRWCRDIDIAPVKQVVGQEVRIDEFHLGPVFGSASLLHGGLFEGRVVP